MLDKGFDTKAIMLMVEKYDADKWSSGHSPVVWEPYEHYEPSSLAEAICDLRGVYYHQLMYVLGEVNGKDWVDTYKKRGEE